MSSRRWDCFLPATRRPMSTARPSQSTADSPARCRMRANRFEVSSLRGAKRRSNPASRLLKDGLLCSARNDANCEIVLLTREAEAMTSLSRGADASELVKRTTLEKQEGAGKAGRRLHPWVPCKKSTGVGPQVQPDRPAFPAQWFYGLLRTVPGV